MEELLTKLIVLGFKKIDIYYVLKDIIVRPFFKTGNVYISCNRSKLRGIDKFPNYKEALSLIVELL